jgi:hypothetical protein
LISSPRCGTPGLTVTGTPTNRRNPTDVRNGRSAVCGEHVQQRATEAI